jgi:tetratricopeptide (TPR) repeat protein
MRALAIVGSICLITISGVASDLATSYQQAAALGDAQERAPATRDYFRGTLLPYYAQEYAPVLQSCFATVTHPEDGPFSFVVAIGDNGQVLRLYNDRETNIFACLRESLKKDVFPRPPLSPYYLHIDMKFGGNNATAPSSTSAQGQQDQSLGSAARRLRAEKAEQAGKMAPPDWAVGPPNANHDPISDAQLVGWAAGGVPSEDLIAELHKRGIAFLPSRELDELLRQAGADSSVVEELSKTERSGSSLSNPGEMTALAKIVAAQEHQDYRRGLREIVALLKTDSKNPGLYVLLGHFCDMQEEWSTMAGAFSAAIQLDRDFAYSHGQLSLACYKMEIGCAKTEAEAMLALQPRSSDGYKYLGLAHAMAGNVPSALADYQKALALGSKTPDLIYYDIGLAKASANDISGAVEAYRRAILINPNDWRAFNALGSAYVSLGNIDEGVVNLRKAKAIAPSRLDIRQNLGAAFCNSGRHADAVVEFEELLQLDPDWNMARRCLAKSLRALGQLEEAQKVLDEYHRRETQ